MNPPTTLTQAIEMYLADRTSSGEYVERTAANVGERLRRFTRELSDPHPGDVTASDVKEFLAGLDVRPSTRSLYHSTISTFFSWLVFEGYVPVNPAAGVRRPKVPRGADRSLSPAEVDAVRAQCQGSGGTRGRLIFWLLYSGGLRCIELARMRVEDIDLDTRTMRVRGKGHGGDVSRELPIADELAHAIKLYLDDAPELSGPLLRKKKNRGSELTDRPLSSRDIGRLVSDWMADAGVKSEGFDGVSAHALRHTASEEMAGAADDIRVVQHFLGHANLATTDTYLRRKPAGMAEAMAARFGGAS